MHTADMSHQQKGGRGGGRFGGRGRGGREGGGRGRGRGGGAGPSDFGGLWDPTVKWFFEDADGGGGGGGAPPKGGLEKGINKKRARDYHVKGREGARAPSLDDARKTAVLELRRYKLVKRLRHQLALKCGQLQVKPPLLVFERWLARAMLEDGDDAVPTPMFPAVDAEGGLAQDLRRAGAEDAAAAAAADELAAQAGAIAGKLTEARGDDDDGEEAAAGKKDAVTAEDAGPLLALKVNGEKPYMSVSKAHMGKLRALYCRHSLGGAPRPAEGTPEHGAFIAATFSLLARYDALGGAGYQAALNETAFDVLKKRLGVGCEAFASPLNCRYGRFCSAFPDVDGPFGSLGSFFQFAPTRGSFEMNPPFVPEVLTAAAERAESLLAAAEESGGRLSFVVVVPAWRDVPMWRALDESRFKRGETLVVCASDHGFCDGAQHCRPPRERHRVSSYDTGVFFLQTSAGARRWPVTDEIRAELVGAMKQAVGSAKSVGDLERRFRPNSGGKGGFAKKEQRGAEKEPRRVENETGGGEEAGGVDEDGGGGEDDGGGEKKRRRRRRKHED